MKVITERLIQLEDGIHLLDLFHVASSNLFILNYLQHPTFNHDWSESYKTVMVDFDTKNITRLPNGMQVLEVTSQGKLFAVENDFSDDKRQLVVYDLKRQTFTTRIPVRLFYSHGRSYLIEDEICKLFISFFGYSGGKNEVPSPGLVVIDVRNDRIIKELSPGGSPSALAAVKEKDRMFVSFSGLGTPSRLVCLDTRTDEILESFELGFYPVRIKSGGDALLLLELYKGIHIFDLAQKRVTDIKSFPDIHGFDLAPGSRFLVGLFEGKKPYRVTNKLAVYDLIDDSVVAERKISHGHRVKTVGERMFFTELVDKTLTINELRLSGLPETALIHRGD